MEPHASPSSTEALRVQGQAIPNLRDRLPKLEPRKKRPTPSNQQPVPATPPLPSPPDLTGWQFKTPVKRILSQQDLDQFEKSSESGIVLAWVLGLADSVKGIPRSAVKADSLSANIKTMLSILDEILELVDQNPPNEQGGSRFGNRAFTGFLDAVEAKQTEWHRRLGIQDDAAIAEVSTYLQQSFGNRSRIDYGSGHELNFVLWLLCLYQLRVVQHTDFQALVLHVFARYLDLMRAVQMTYYLEPAGSHGVWGLDDYQFLPFLFGASQLLDHPYITPRGIHQELTIEEFGSEYLYLGQVAFVNSTKTVKGLRWHSPMLDDISSAKSWAKIDVGMRRMFIAEVLGKLPVMQHFLFGSLVPAAEGMSQPQENTREENGGQRQENEADDHDGHAHDGTGWGDCCGIKVPSSIAAAQEMKKMGQSQALRRIPFD